jgi:hypothetical protein
MLYHKRLLHAIIKILSGWFDTTNYLFYNRINVFQNITKESEKTK